jgi:dihydroxyacetone kinase
MSRTLEELVKHWYAESKRTEINSPHNVFSLCAAQLQAALDVGATPAGVEEAVDYYAGMFMQLETGTADDSDVERTRNAVHAAIAAHVAARVAEERERVVGMISERKLYQALADARTTTGDNWGELSADLVAQYERAAAQLRLTVLSHANEPAFDKSR